MYEFIKLPTKEPLQELRVTLMKLASSYPDLDIVVNAVISAINTEKETRLPVRVIIQRRLAVDEFEVEEDRVILGDALTRLAERLRELFLLFDLYTETGVPYRFWSTVDDDCILQHNASPTSPPGDTYRRTRLPDDIPLPLP